MNKPQSNLFSIRQALSTPAAWLVLLNVIVFGVLLARILASQLFGSSPSDLLLNGLNNQISRLEIIADGPCDSTGMRQVQRGEIGPISNSPESEADLPQASARPVASGSSGSSVAAPPEPVQDPGTPTSPPGPAGEMLNPEDLRSLVQRSVVLVVTETGWAGTGFAVTPNIVVTNRHVIEDAGTGYIIVSSKFLGPEPVPVKLLFRSPVGEADFAVLELQGGKLLEPLSVGSNPKPLDNVVAAGFPGVTVKYDSDSVSPDVVFTQGEVSVVQPQPNGVDYVVHTANIDHGSSGGPLLNRCGTVVGVNTFGETDKDSSGRALFALAPVALANYLSSVAVPFHQASSECASGGG